MRQACGESLFCTLIQAKKKVRENRSADSAGTDDKICPGFLVVCFVAFAPCTVDIHGLEITQKTEQFS